MFADVIAKDFEIELDDKPYTVKNERWLGIILNEDAEGDEPYFSGYIYDWNEELNAYTDGQGTISYTRKEFDERAKSVEFFE